MVIIIQIKVAVCGSAGGIGQPLSALLAQNPHVGDLALFDVVPAVFGVCRIVLK